VRRAVWQDGRRREQQHDRQACRRGGARAFSAFAAGAAAFDNAGAAGRDAWIYFHSILRSLCIFFSFMPSTKNSCSEGGLARVHFFWLMGGQLRHTPSPHICVLFILPCYVLRLLQTGDYHSCMSQSQAVKQRLTMAASGRQADIAFTTPTYTARTCRTCLSGAGFAGNIH